MTAHRTIAASLASQHAAPALTICAALNGYRVAFIGGATFETVAIFPTWEEAAAALKAARETTARLFHAPNL